MATITSNKDKKTESKRSYDPTRIGRSLIDTQQRMADIIDFLPDATFVIDQDGRVIAWNKAAEELTGVKAENILGKGDFEYSIPFYGYRRPTLIDLAREPLELVERTYSELTRRGKTVIGENFCPAVGKSGAYIRATAAPLFDSHGSVVGAIESMRDATEQRRTEEELLRIKKAVESASNAIWLTDEKAKYATYVNESFTKLFKYKKDEINARGGTSVLFSDLQLAKKVYRNTKSGNSWLGELVMKNQDGEDVMVSLFGDVVKDEMGKTIAYLGIITDITEKKQAETALPESKQRLTDIIDFLPDATLVIDRKGKVIAWNRAIEEMTGVKAEEMLGRGDYEYSIPFYGKRKPILIDMVINPDKSIEEDYYFIKRDKEVLIAEISTSFVKGKEAILWGKANILYDTNGNVVGAIESIRDVTERKKVEEEIRRSEERYRRIIETANEGIWILDEKYNTRFVNQKMAEMIGHTVDEMLGVSLYEFMNTEEVPLSMEKRERRIQGINEHYDFKFRRKDGAELWTIISTNATFDRDGKYSGTLGMITDITERKQTEEILKRYERLYESTREIILFIKKDGRIIEGNQSAINAYGFSREELLEMDINTIRPYDKDSLIAEQLAKAENEGILFETMHRRKDGSVFPVEVSSQATIYNGERILMSIVRDITSRRQAEEELKETQQRMADINNFLPDATLVIDLAGRIISWNKAAEEMTGIPAEEMIGKGDYEYSLPFYGCRMPLLIDLVLLPDKELERNYPFIERKGNILIGENCCPSVRGKGAYLRATASPLYDSRGVIVGAIESIRDATEQKKAEEQMKYLSLHDALTGLYNRTYFEEEMHRLQHGRYANSVGIIACDIDGLKLVNDSFGHESGDRLLRAATDVLKKSFQEGDLIARVGGDEFAIILLNVVDRILEDSILRVRMMEEEYNQRNPELPLSISLGFAVSSDRTSNVYELFRQADNNMYREKLRRKKSARSAIVQTLMKALEARDFLTKGHAERLQTFALKIAKKIGLSDQKINDLILLAQFHDIGKVGVADRILFKPGPLTPEETLEMQRHCEMGYHIAQAAPDLATISDWILKHQEWWNGMGYPLGLRGEEIPLECRIIAIADAFDAMTSDRPYRRAMSKLKAINELRRCAGTQFDAELVNKFIEIISEMEQDTLLDVAN